MESKKVRYIFDNNNVMISKYQLIFLYTLIFWALIYLFSICFSAFLGCYRRWVSF